MNNTLTGFAIVLILLLFVFGLSEILYKKGVASCFTRKIVHIGGALISASFPFFIGLKVVIFLGVGFSLMLLLSKRKKLLNSIHGTGGKSIGALVFPSSVMLTAILFWPIDVSIYQGSILILGLSDGLGGLIGKKFGKKKYSVTGIKTIEGSIVFFIITTIILSLVLYANGVFFDNKGLLIFFGAFIITLAEGFFGKGWDNLSVPITAGIVLFGLMHLL